MESLDLSNNRKVSNSLHKNLMRLKGTKTYYFPSLTYKELLSINDLKHQMYYKSRAKKLKNSYTNFHTEVLKTNIKGNSKYLSIYSNLSKQTTSNDSKFPELNDQKKIKKDKIIKLYMNSNTISVFNKGLFNKNLKNNYKNILKYNKTMNKFNMSNISTSGNMSISINSYKLSKLNKFASNSSDKNSISHLYNNKNANNSNNSINDNNSFEQKIKAYNSYDNSSINQKSNINKTTNNNENLVLSKSNSNSSYIYENFNKKFVSNLNPIYTLLRNEFLSEFNRKTKDISYLKYLFRKKKIDIELEKEKRISDVQKQDLNNYNIKQLFYFFNKYNDSKFEYLNYLKKTVSNEKEINEKLKEDKITIMYDIYTIRHKTLRLENRFRNYLNDKFFLLSVKNHSFTLNKFCKEDQEDYNKDLKKLEILNIMLKVTAKEFDNNNEVDNENNINNFQKKNSFKKLALAKPNNKTSMFYNNAMSPVKPKRQNVKSPTKKKYSLYDSSPILSSQQRKLLKTNFKAVPIYNDIYDFNRDLQQTSNNIQYSLVQYNIISKELQIMRNNLYKNKIEMINLKKYEDFISQEIIIYKKNLDNLKSLNLNLQNYKKYLLNIKVLNLNQGIVCDKIEKIVNKIENTKDNILLEKFEYLKRGMGTEDKINLIYIEKVFEFLLNFKEIQKAKDDLQYRIIESKIENKNRIKMSMFKQENAQKKIDSLIEKVINKNRKIIFASRRKVNIGFNPEIHNRKKQKQNNNNNNYFGNFDLD